MGNLLSFFDFHNTRKIGCSRILVIRGWVLSLSCWASWWQANSFYNITAHFWLWETKQIHSCKYENKKHTKSQGHLEMASASLYSLHCRFYSLNPLSTNSDHYLYYFLLTKSIHNQEKRLWEFMKWSPKGKCFDLLTNSLNWFFRNCMEISLVNSSSDIGA